MSELKELTPEIYEQMKTNNNVDSVPLFYWSNISRRYKLSENIIKEFKDKWSWDDWFWMSRDQELSEDMIREFQNHVNWMWVSSLQKISYEFIIEFLYRINLKFLGYPKNPNLNLTDEQWTVIETLKQMTKN